MSQPQARRLLVRCGALWPRALFGLPKSFTYQDAHAVAMTVAAPATGTPSQFMSFARTDFRAFAWIACNLNLSLAARHLKFHAHGIELAWGGPGRACA